ncbi:MAG: hypothetical protein Q8R86_00720 [Sulfuricurvum sp.]|nr:hypothetical protein [Sulfuricurvum sp.]MDP3464273.1 hypothetical protein [Sulfuricurvum sp.]
MKLGKLSLVAVLALGTSAFAIDNVKVNGEAKLWYQTSEFSGQGAGATTSQDFFDHNTNSVAEVKLSVGATADLLQNLSAGVKMTALTTLGLENNLVGAVPAAKFTSAGTSAGAAQLDDQSWVEEAYLAYTMGKTTAKIGRQALSTPLAFTENWNVVDNTFEAAVLLNNDLPDTTLVGAWVGKHNGVGLLQPTAGRGTTVAYSGDFSTFATDGAYAFAAVNKSIPNTTLQAWYYDVVQVADAYWLQADAKVMDMVNVGVQYAGMDPKLASSGTSDRSTDVLAVKAAVDVAGVNLYAAYSTVGAGTLGFANVATGDKSSVYTALGSVYMDGEIAAAPDTDTWKIGASTKMVPGVSLSASYAQAETGSNGGTAGAIAGASTLNTDFTAWDVIANTKVGPLDVTAIYTQFDKDVKATDTTDKTTDTLRIIASLKF